MRFGFPGDNLHLENHGVSEESFWPSFTDIMMVIVMVFLLVTVSVILNNWALIGDLKQSISAQKVASSLIESKQQENQDLASKLNTLTQQFATVESEKKTEEQKLSEALLALATSQTKADKLTLNLNQANTSQNKKTEAIKKLEVQITAQENSLSASKELADKLISNLAMMTKSRDGKSQELSRINGLLAEKVDEETRLKKALKEKNSELMLSKKAEETLISERDASAKVSKEQTTKLTRLEKSSTELKTALTALQASRGDSATEFDALKKEHQELLLDLETTLKEKEKQSAHVATLKKSKAAMKKILTALQADRGSVADKLLKLQNQLAIADKEKESNDDVENKKDEKIESLLASNKEQLTSIENLKEENERLSGDIVTKLTDTESDLEALKTHTEELKTQLESKDIAITALQKERTTTETQLLSLKGEFDTLDTKYQKLLQPARSSKGKFVVSVSYKKSGKKRIIRLKSSPNGSYKTVKKSELYKRLSKLKEKHKTDLYIKVIIPSNSNLSHNDAWKFTTNLQQKYDYYFQSDKSK
ncbi:MAG: hypothetical protein V3V19_01635 [Cocleimonas sp.]